MTAKLDKEKEEKPKSLDSLKFPETKKLLTRICKSLGFKLFRHQCCWFLAVDNNNDDYIVVFLEDHSRNRFQTAKELLRGILSSRIFIKIWSAKTYDDKTIQNPFYNLVFPALQIKLDLILA